MGQEAEKGGDRERRACSAKVAGGGRLGIARGAPSASRTISRTPANGSSPGSAAFGGCCCGCCLRVRSAANCAASSPESCCCISALRDGLRHAGRCTSAGSTAIINSGVRHSSLCLRARYVGRARRISFHPSSLRGAAATREVERGDTCKRNTSSSGAVLAARPHEVNTALTPTNTTFSAC